MTVKYVCISDLHLGARHSLLTNLLDDGRVDNSAPSGTMTAFATLMDTLLQTLPCDSNTQLVLLGDVLDMGFSEMPDVIKTFENFAKALLTSTGFKKISRNIVFIPGNHDHQLWEGVKDIHLVNQINSGAGDKLMQVTQLVAPEHLESYLLRDVVRTLPGLEDITVQIAYPNLASIAGNRGVIFHHGHYTESMYLTMSNLRKAISGALEITDDISQIEKENGYWINFLWSSLGDASFGGSAFNLYETMLDPGASHAFVVNYATRLKDYLIDNFNVSNASLASVNKNLTLDMATRAALEASVGSFANLERNSMLNVFSDDSIAMLKWYLKGPVLNQFAAMGTPVPDAVTFVFGHTHKPFVDRMPVDGYKFPVNVFNTGGWAIDSPVVSSTQGAAVVFVDSDNNVASLRLFNCSPDGQVSPAYAADTGDPNFASNPMLDLLNAAIANPKLDWTGFQDIVSGAVFFRAGNALKRFFDAGSVTGFRQVGSKL